MRPIRSLHRLVPLAAVAMLAGCASAPARDAGVAPDGAARAERAIERACGAATARGLGAELATVHDFEPAARARAAGSLGIGEALEVVLLQRGSPADAAGLRLGDRIEAVDGVPIAAGATARGAFSLAAGTPHAERELRVRRDGDTLVLRVAPRSGCRTQV